MILTGKCKETFLGWSMYTEETFDLTQELFQHALIIDFFDSVGIYVNAIRYSDKFKPIADYELQEVYNSRTEATTEAIKKANEIFNNRNHD